MKAEKADQFSEMSLIEITKSLAKMWRELPLEDKHMVTESFDKVTGSYNGYINVGDGCWRPNVLVTSLRCW